MVPGRNAGQTARWGLFLVLLLLPGQGIGAAEVVARVQALSGLVEAQREGDWYQLETGDELELGDRVRTDLDALVRLEFLDRDPASGAEATLVDLGGDSELDLSEFLVERGESPRRSGFLDVLRGTLHALTQGWRNGSVFSVRAGTSVCGIRGSVASIAFDPADQTATVTSLEGEVFTFEAADRAEARRRHRENMLALRERRPLAFGKRLGVGIRAIRAGRAERRLERLDPELLSRARAALRSGRGAGGFQGLRGWVGAFARVRPSRTERRKPSGRRLREVFGSGRPRRRLLPASENRQERGTGTGTGVRERIQERLGKRLDRGGRGSPSEKRLRPTGQERLLEKRQRLRKLRRRRRR